MYYDEPSGEKTEDQGEQDQNLAFDTVVLPLSAIADAVIASRLGMAAGRGDGRIRCCGSRLVQGSLALG